MAQNSMTIEIDGLEEIIDLAKRLGDFPPNLVTAGAKAGAKIAQAKAIHNAPEEEGNLKKGIILKGERKKGSKKIYRVTIDPKMNDVFVKYSNGNRYYYPASIEYGFIGKDGKKVNGVHFLERALTENNSRIEAETLKGLIIKIEKELKKKG